MNFYKMRNLHLTRSSDGNEKFMTLAMATFYTKILIFLWENIVVMLYLNCLANLATNPPIFEDKQYSEVSD